DGRAADGQREQLVVVAKVLGLAPGDLRGAHGLPHDLVDDDGDPADGDEQDDRGDLGRAVGTGNSDQYGGDGEEPDEEPGGVRRDTTNQALRRKRFRGKPMYEAWRHRLSLTPPGWACGAQGLNFIGRQAG